MQAAPAESWVDVGEITVPAGTKRRTVVERALAVMHVEFEPGQSAKMRVVPAEFAQAIPVATEQPPPRLKIG